MSQQRCLSLYLFWVQAPCTDKRYMVNRTIYSPEMRTLTTWLREQRERQGLTMRTLADRLGKPHSFVQKVEQGERRLDVVEYLWYCSALGAPPKDGIDLISNLHISLSLQETRSHNKR